MRIIKLHGKITVQFMGAEFTSNGDFAETLKDIAKSKGINFDSLLNTFCSQMLSNIEEGNVINYQYGKDFDSNNFYIIVDSFNSSGML